MRSEDHALRADADGATLRLPRLDLDHIGCIVNDLAAGAAKWERLGFTLTPRSKQRGAVPQREGFHPWATANRCAIFGNTYLELIGVIDAAAYNPWARFIGKNEGLHILALRCDDANAAHEALSSRTDALAPPVPRERVLDVAGEARTMRFRNIFSRDEIWPEARYLLIEHQTPDYLWQPRYQHHENGATELVDVTLVAQKPRALLSRFETLGAGCEERADGSLAAKLPGRGHLYIVSATAFAQAYGYLPEARSALHALTVGFRDLARTLALLASRGVRVRESARGHWLGPEDANGFVMHLVQEST